MAESIMALKKRAVKAGMDKAEARKAGRDTLLKFLNSADKKAGKSSAKKKGSASKKSTAAKKKGTGASKKNSSAKKTTSKKSSKSKKGNSDVGRAAIGKLKFTGYDEDDWNPRPTSGTGIIFKALKKNKGDVDKTFDALKGQASKLIGKTMKSGAKRSKASINAMLKYRINRTKFDFAIRTGQHETGTDRVEYGSGKYAKATKAANRKSSKGKGKKKGGKKKK